MDTTTSNAGRLKIATTTQYTIRQFIVAGKHLKVTSRASSPNWSGKPLHRPEPRQARTQEDDRGHHRPVHIEYPYMGIICLLRMGNAMPPHRSELVRSPCGVDTWVGALLSE